MSEYQYYEFQAVDRRLTKQEVDELRSHSTRARITATSFVNEYSWGSFRGDEDAWMEKYFDAFLYLANWGTHILKLRLPTRLLDLGTTRQYWGESASVHEKNGKTILTFVSEDEEGGEWVEGEGQLSSLISVRSELAGGDLRALYLGWLQCAQNGELDDDDIEPAVPAGLGQLSASLSSFAEFLRVDTDLIDAAAEASSPLIETEPSPREVRDWLAELNVTDKDDLLARLMAGDDAALGSELVQRMRRERANQDDPAQAVAERRTVAALLRAREAAADERSRIAAEKTARDRAMQLDRLVGNEPMLWKKVESLIVTKQPKGYEQAVELLADLRDLAARRNLPGFRQQIEALRAAHGAKRTLIARLDEAGL